MSLCNEALAMLIRSRLAQDCRISALPIDITCRDGEVCLLGSVDTPYQKQLAVELVTGMIGVRTIVDELVIRPLPGVGVRK